MGVQLSLVGVTCFLVIAVRCRRHWIVSMARDMGTTAQLHLLCLTHLVVNSRCAHLERCVMLRLVGGSIRSRIVMDVDVCHADHTRCAQHGS